MAKNAGGCIYMDNNATTPLRRCALQELVTWSQCANPSSTKHALGRQAHEAVEGARKRVARCLNVPAAGLYFTSGATEADNMAIQGVAKAYHMRTGRPGHIVCSAIEHKACLEPCKALEQLGWRVTYVAPEDGGIVAAETVQRALQRDTCLVVVMHANNELGTLQQVGRIGALARRRRIAFHCDCAQSAGRVPGGIKPARWGATSVAISGHKFGGPKGVGALWLAKNCRCAPLSLGGAQEGGVRPGTENVGGIMAMAAALEASLRDRSVRNEHLRYMCRDEILGEFKRLGVPCQLLGTPSWAPDKRLANTLLVTFPRSPARPRKAICNSKLVKFLDEGAPPVAVSIGSACNTKSKHASHVLDAIGATPEMRQGCLRISLGDQNTPEECRLVAERIRDGLAAQGHVYS